MIVTVHGNNATHIRVNAANTNYATFDSLPLNFKERIDFWVLFSKMNAHFKDRRVIFILGVILPFATISWCQICGKTSSGGSFLLLLCVFNPLLFLVEIHKKGQISCEKKLRLALKTRAGRCHLAILYADRRDRRKSPGVPGAAIAIFAGSRDRRIKSPILAGMSDFGD